MTLLYATPAELHFASKNQSVLVVLLGDGLVVLGVGQVTLVGRVALGGEDGRLRVADEGAPAQVRHGGDGGGLGEAFPMNMNEIQNSNTSSS